MGEAVDVRSRRSQIPATGTSPGIVTLVYRWYGRLRYGHRQLTRDWGRGWSLWSRYLREWTFWNHVRSGSALVAAALLTIALVNA